MTMMLTFMFVILILGSATMINGCAICSAKKLSLLLYLKSQSTALRIALDPYDIAIVAFVNRHRLLHRYFLIIAANTIIWPIYFDMNEWLLLLLGVGLFSFAIGTVIAFHPFETLVKEAEIIVAIEQQNSQTG